MLLVVHIPKTAGTSLRHELVEHCTIAKYGAYPCPEQIIALVREPLARMFIGLADAHSLDVGEFDATS